jgi:hypothetical protein
MSKLADVLLAPNRRAAVISDCKLIINQEVGDKKGLTGLAVKAAFKTVKTINPSIIGSVIDVLLDDFVVQLEPTYQAYLDSESKALEPYCIAHADDIANALLVITDRRAQRSKIKTLVKAYGKLRPQGQKHVKEAVPRIARLLSRHGL